MPPSDSFTIGEGLTTVPSHFALETHLEEIAVAMRVFLGRLPPDEPRLKEVPAVIEEAASLLSRSNAK
jgi:hypothetical protein